MKKYAKKQKIDFHNNFKDFEVIYYVGIGLTYQTVAELTGFTIGQIEKRLKTAGVRGRDYRHGKSQIAHWIMRNTRSMAEKHIMRLLP